MPRSKTHARRRAARLAADPSIYDPERTVGRIGHFYRKVWHRFARLEDYDIRCAGQAIPDRRTRRLAILARIEKWFASAIADDKARGSE